MTQQLFQEIGKKLNSHGYQEWSEAVYERLVKYGIEYPIILDEVLKKIDRYAEDRNIQLIDDKVVAAKAFFRFYFTDLYDWLGKNMAIGDFVDLESRQSEIECHRERVLKLQNQVDVVNPVRQQLDDRMKLLEELNKLNQLKQQIPEHNLEDKEEDVDMDSASDPLTLMEEVQGMKRKFAELEKKKQESVESNPTASAFIKKFQPQIERELIETNSFYKSSKMNDLYRLEESGGITQLQKHVQESERILAKAKRLFEVKPSGCPGRFVDMMWKEPKPLKKPELKPLLKTEEFPHKRIKFNGGESDKFEPQTVPMQTSCTITSGALEGNVNEDKSSTNAGKSDFVADSNMPEIGKDEEKETKEDVDMKFEQDEQMETNQNFCQCNK